MWILTRKMLHGRWQGQEEIARFRLADILTVTESLSGTEQPIMVSTARSNRLGRGRWQFDSRYPRGRAVGKSRRQEMAGISKP